MLSEGSRSSQGRPTLDEPGSSGLLAGGQESRLRPTTHRLERPWSRGQWPLGRDDARHRSLSRNHRLADRPAERHSPTLAGDYAGSLEVRMDLRRVATEQPALRPSDSRLTVTKCVTSAGVRRRARRGPASRRFSVVLAVDEAAPGCPASFPRSALAVGVAFEFAIDPGCPQAGTTPHAAVNVSRRMTRDWG